MPQIYYDEFSRLPKDKMAQKMENMTFAYNETRVPKKHYKKLLDMAQDRLKKWTINSSSELYKISCFNNQKSINFILITML